MDAKRNWLIWQTGYGYTLVLEARYTQNNYQQLRVRPSAENKFRFRKPLDKLFQTSGVLMKNIQVSCTGCERGP